MCNGQQPNQPQETQKCQESHPAEVENRLVDAKTLLKLREGDIAHGLPITPKIGRLKFEEATADGFMGTDEASLIERSGGTVHVVMGSPRNMKITTPADLELAEFFLSQENRRKASLGG